MGFTMIQIAALLRSEGDIKSIEDALERLEMHDLGYNHKYVNYDLTDKCVICGHIKGMHAAENMAKLESGDYESIEDLKIHLENLKKEEAEDKAVDEVKERRSSE